jgi:hypothetical protein
MPGRDYTHPTPGKRSSAPRYTLTVEPLPNIDGIKALRWTLKSMLRRHGLKCVAVSEGEGHKPGKHEREIVERS